MLFFLYHFIEWLRYTILLTCILLGVNLVQIFYLLGLNTLFGVIVLVVAAVTRFGSDGADCAQEQTTRGVFLIVAMIVFALKISFSFCPTMWFKFISVE